MRISQKLGRFGGGPHDKDVYIGVPYVGNYQMELSETYGSERLFSLCHFNGACMNIGWDWRSYMPLNPKP